MDGNGSVGIGTQTPYSKLHIVTGASAVSPTNSYSGDMIVQGNTGGRNVFNGASIEFVVPANADGSNPWGQGRIITVAGNSNSGDATGKMIIGTRSFFDKGEGQGWNYGDDIVIDGAGRVGIGTTDPKGYKLAVAGNIISESVTVKLQSQWPDYFFKSNYKLPSLTTVKAYIDKNQHLPDMPSETEVAKDGVNLGEMNKLLLKKVEELTLYLIQKDKQLSTERAVNHKQQQNISALSRRLSKIENKKKQTEM